MEIEIYTDGGSTNNPGQAAIAFLIYLNKKLVLRRSKKIGVASNNQAEYKALIASLETTKKIINQRPGIKKIVCYSDSSLVVNQLNGLFKVKSPVIRENIMRVRVLEQDIGVLVVYRNIPREQNTLADSLIKKELKK